MFCCLGGTRVLEYCETPAGEYCAKLLADFGAEVIKIEPPSGDPLRNRPPFFGDVPHPERSCLFFYLNVNKLGVTLNLNLATGREIFARLAAGVDVVVEDQHPAAVDKFALDFASLSLLNKRMVVASVTPFGRHGPHSHYQAYPLNVYQAGGDGYLLQSGKDYLGREPVKAAGFAGEYEAATQATLGILAALRRAQRTGAGQHVDVSKQESLMGLNRELVNRHANGRASESRATRSYPYAGIIPCKDGYIIMQIPAEHLWQRLVQMMGSPAWTKEARFADERSRVAHGEEVNEQLRRWMGDYTKEELCQMSHQWSVPLAKVATTADVVASGQLRHRNFFVEVEHPEIGKVFCPSSPYQMAGVPVRPMTAAPTLGQHNGAVYGERLGYSAEELGRLRCCGVI